MPVGPDLGSVGGAPYEAVPRRASLAGCHLDPLATRRESLNPHMLPLLKSLLFIGLPPCVLQMSLTFHTTSARVTRDVLRSREQKRSIF